MLLSDFSTLTLRSDFSELFGLSGLSELSGLAWASLTAAKRRRETLFSGSRLLAAGSVVLRATLLSGSPESALRNSAAGAWTGFESGRTVLGALGSDPPVETGFGAAAATGVGGGVGAGVGVGAGSSAGATGGTETLRGRGIPGAALTSGMDGDNVVGSSFRFGFRRGGSAGLDVNDGFGPGLGTGPETGFGVGFGVGGGIPIPSVSDSAMGGGVGAAKTRRISSSSMAR
jgi:hypothetical protein